MELLVPELGTTECSKNPVIHNCGIIPLFLAEILFASILFTTVRRDGVL